FPHCWIINQTVDAKEKPPHHFPSLAKAPAAPSSPALFCSGLRPLSSSLPAPLPLRSLLLPRHSPLRLQITMGSVGTGLLKGLRRVLEQQRKSVDLCRTSRAWSSTVSFSDIDEKDDMGDDGDLKDSRRELEPQSVDPKKGWGFRGVHRVFICYVIQ
uniref:Uncharacterized protein n=1 Tax=Aegilops tauschii subsp. strangulata TaxID=200361 RepID=A0A452ZI34_AEGTS